MWRFQWFWNGTESFPRNVSVSDSLCECWRCSRHWAAPVSQLWSQAVFALLTHTSSCEAWHWVSCLHSALWESNKAHLNCPLPWRAFFPSVFPAVTNGEWDLSVVCRLYGPLLWYVPCVLCGEPWKAWYYVLCLQNHIHWGLIVPTSCMLGYPGKNPPYWVLVSLFMGFCWN